MTKGSDITVAGVLANAHRLVVKVGSAMLCDEDGEVRATWLATLAADIAQVLKDGKQVVVVTSGAVALGRKRLNLGARLRIDEKQAASAAGQVTLATAWQSAFASHDIEVAQILLTLDDTENRRRYVNARATMRTLIDIGAVPIVNENDSIATGEIRYGDNDRLAAHVAQLTESDVLVLLSDVDGLYTADPRRDAAATHIPVVDAITPEIEASADGPNRIAGLGVGGMESKIKAAKIAAAAGCATVIASGHVSHPISAILNGGRSTLFRALTSRDSARRQWIGGRLKPAGEISIDAGAAAALKKGASLLPAGIVAVKGEFTRGDAVSVRAPDGEILGQGLSSFHADEIRKIQGRRSEDIEGLLGYRRRPSVIEKNDLVLRAD